MNEEIPLPEITGLEHLTVQVSALTMAFRALLSAHPQPAEVARVFDQLQAQAVAHPGFLTHPKNAEILRAMKEVMFRPALQLDQ